MSSTEKAFTNQRKHKRNSVLADAIIEYEGKEATGKVRDISVGGAKLEILIPAIGNSPINLKIDQFGAIPAEIAWQRENQLGLKFLRDPEQAAEMLTAIAVYG